MKQDYPKLGIEALCRLFGKTRHAYYDHLWRQEQNLLKDDLILYHVLKFRENMPRIGVRKLHYLLSEQLTTDGFKIGRDYLFNLLSEHKLLVRQRKRKAITTNSKHWMHKYNNLIKELEITRPEQVWVSDITYIKLNQQWGYLSLITDAYSKRIMGYNFRNNLQADGCVEALSMAVKSRQYNQSLIHHSDRGSQYCSKAYIDLLLKHNIAVSMTENGDPYENAIAERINGILKTEFNLHYSTNSFELTLTTIAKCIEVYNQQRPHASCDFLTPNQAHSHEGTLKRRWKNYNNYFIENKV